MDDDLNSPMVISELFDCVRTINQIYDGKQTISAADLAELRRVVDLFVFDILGLRDDLAGDNSQMLSSVVDMILNIRMEAKNAKDWATSDKIRDGLAAIGIKVKDRKRRFRLGGGVGAKRDASGIVVPPKTPAPPGLSGRRRRFIWIYAGRVFDRPVFAYFSTTRALSLFAKGVRPRFPDSSCAILFTRIRRPCIGCSCRYSFSAAASAKAGYIPRPAS